MNVRELSVGVLARTSEQPWRAWGSQIRVLIQRELRRGLFTKRRIWIYLLAFTPTLITLIHRVGQFSDAVDATGLRDETQVLAGIVQLYYVKLGLFFACMGIFSWLFRGEMVERTLHYAFLSPVRREVLVIGKFLAGAITAILLFETALLGCFYFIYSRLGALGTAYVFHGPGLQQIGAYALVIALGALGYGAVFLGLSLAFKNPIVPGALFFGWEAITPILPRTLQLLSIPFYLKQLYPIRITPPGILSLFTIEPEPLSWFATIVRLLCFTAAVLVFSCYRIRKVEITYTTD